MRKAELRQKLGAEREKCTRSVKQQASVNENGIQSAKISSNECAACLGAYEDDIIDGELNGSSALTHMPVENGCIAAASLQMRVGCIFVLSVKSHFLDFNDSHARCLFHTYCYCLPTSIVFVMLINFTFISNYLKVKTAVHNIIL